ncbi:SMP-30/gluconolactonase/LRE family protein [Arenibacter sp. GZD96]|uniref:SMP-30/gluconolactonase/LRE family protein n=1 Tax=Aurantibrevibacter litoralis TaxID=3106030 RepID=UPI002AFE8023|nr:SMP-30/gluconolactonase/LRE family protein [Arenibacter sp. GZD-96]MEA1785350.1 SMP-30/gluconolactonase/LRE family protein [Arenibacter sp. GZD-96]
MKKLRITLLPFAILLLACKEVPQKEISQPETKEFHFSIEILDDEALNLLDPEAELKVLAGGFQWTEGPLWISSGNYLLFSEIPGNKVYKWDAVNDTTVYLQPSGYSGAGYYSKEPGANGLLLNPQGELVLMQHGDRRIVKMNAPLDAPSTNFITLVDNYQGKKLNSPNDGVFDREGNLYFTDPPYGLPAGMADPSKELDFQGVYFLRTNGELILLDKLSRPNGIVLSTDEKTLYVAVSDESHAVWYTYDIEDPGQVANKHLFYDVTHLIGKEGEQGLPDGMVMHSRNYLFATGPGGVWVFTEKAKAIARIHTGLATSNCTFSADEHTLYITADDFLLSVDVL